MGKIIEAKAVISAQDSTGNVFDRIAQKIKGVEKAAKSFEGIKPLAKMGWGAGFDKEIDRMKVNARELATIQKSWESFNSALSRNGPMSAAKALGALDMWKRGTLNSLREVKRGFDEVEGAHRRFFRGAGRFAVTAAGVGGAAYATERGVKAGVKSAAERSREMARYGLGGLTDDEKARANAKADEISARNPTIGRTDVLAHIRQLRARLGSFDHALDNVETLTNAQTVLGTLGHGGEGGAADLEKLVLGLESQGVGANPEKFKTFLNAFVKAKSLFPDLTGDKFMQYMQTSNASKYGLSEDYLTTVAPTMMQHNRAPNFGVEQSSAFSALIGGRQTKQAKAAMEAAGLLKDGKLVDEKGFVSNPYEWARSNVKPALSKQGVSMDEEHRGDLVTAVTKMFSNRKVADYIASMLVNESVIEKDKALLKGAKGTEGAAQARREDAFQASASVVTQLKDAAAALLNLGPIISGLNLLADKLSKGTSKFDQGSTADKTGMVLGGGLLAGGAAAGGVLAAKNLYQWFTGAGALTGAAAALDASAAALTAAAVRLAGGAPLSQVAGKVLSPGGAAAAGAAGGGVMSKIWGVGAAALPFVGPAALGVGAYLAAEGANDYSGITRESTRARQRRQQAKYNWWGKYSPQSTGGPEVSDTMTYGTGIGGDKGPVTATLTGSAEVHGEVTSTVIVKPGSELLSIVEQAKQAIRLAGTLNANGPGSTGKSSPDAAAPARAATPTGASGSW